MTALKFRLFPSADPDNDDAPPEEPRTLNDFERAIVLARNAVVHCQADVHAAQMRQEAAEEELRRRQDALRNVLLERQLLD